MKKISLLTVSLLLNTLACSNPSLDKQIQQETDATIRKLFPTQKKESVAPSPCTNIVNCIIEKCDPMIKKGIELYVVCLQFLADKATYSNEESNPFTYNFNPAAKYAAAYLVSRCQSFTFEKYNNTLEKLPQSQSSEQKDAELQARQDLEFSIEQAYAVRKQIVDHDIGQHFPLLFDPATGVLN